MTKRYTGQCACGAVTFAFETDPPAFIADCYCKDCQKASGGAMATFFGVPAEGFEVLSGNPKPFHYIANSGKGLDRNFCPECGSRLFTTNLESFPGAVFVQIGSLDDASDFAAHLEMFTTRRHSWIRPQELPQFDEMPH